MQNNKYLIKVPIIRKNFDKTNSAKFKGIIKFVSNKYGIIYDWKIEFSEVFIDLYSTPSWFLKKTSTFKRREQLFKKLNLQQYPRPSLSEKNILKLSEKKIEILNNFLNNKKEYSSTIKNIVGLLKGNNPGGEAKKPKSAEMIIDSSNSYNNFVILLDDLVMKHRVEYDSVILGSKEISFEEFANLNDHISSAFKFMQKSKEYGEWSNYLDGIKIFYNQYNVDLSTAQRIAKKARTKFSKNIDNKVNNFPFDFSSSISFEKCHIYEFHDLRDKIVESIRENKPYEKYVDMISDINNFLPLPNYIHRKFDSNWFTYKLDGSIYAINEKGFEFINSEVEDRFKKIPGWFMSKERKKYFELRNSNIDWI